MIQQSAVDAGPILLTLGGALGMSVVVERTIEFGKNVIDLLPTKAFGTATCVATEVDEEYHDLLERLTSVRRRTAAREIEKKLKALDAKLADAVDPAVRGKLQIERDAAVNELSAAVRMVEQQEGEFNEGAPLDTLLVQPAADMGLGVTGRKLVLHLLAFAAGIVAAHLGHVGLFNTFLAAIGQPISPPVDYILTGLFIGGGSGPVHTLIRFVTERKYVAQPSQMDQVEVEAPARVTVGGSSAMPEAPAGNGVSPGAVAVAAPPAVTDWVDIPYEPVDVARLESIHRRSGPPNLIIYHHTAMPLSSTFDDLVRVIKSRTTSDGVKWITGYHCVVTGDGGIHAFCRWDRYGNHAAGYNDRSLGVSLNGNFETVERNKWSNYNGAYGPATPPDVQLRNAARIVALWCTLYGIPVDFDSTIIPHKKVNPHKACPGSNFPYAEFEQLVHDFYDKWSASAVMLENIRAFARKPHLGGVHV